MHAQHWFCAILLAFETMSPSALALIFPEPVTWTFLPLIVGSRDDQALADDEFLVFADVLTARTRHTDCLV